MNNCYLYCITDVYNDAPMPVKGIGGKGINHFCYKDIYILYSNLDDDRIEQSLENLKIHNQVAVESLENGVVLPFQFGTIVKNEAGMTATLKGIYEKCKDSFSRLSEKVEMGIKVFGKIADDDLCDPKYSRVMERLAAVKTKTGSVNYLMDRLKFVQEEGVMEQRAKCLADELFLPFKSLTADSKIILGPKDKLLVNGAFLINKEDLQLFREKVESVKENYPQYSFLYSGPWPPYNFVNIKKEGE